MHFLSNFLYVSTLGVIGVVHAMRADDDLRAAAVFERPMIPLTVRSKRIFSVWAIVCAVIWVVNLFNKPRALRVAAKPFPIRSIRPNNSIQAKNPAIIQKPFYLRNPVVLVILTLLLGVLALPGQALPTPIQRRDKGCMSIPATWDDIFIFFSVNYVTHAVTVRSLPGDLPNEILLNSIIALFFPFSGAYRGLMAIHRAAQFGKDQISKAARAGALCIVTRHEEKWRPQSGEIVRGCTIENSVGDRIKVRKGVASVEVQPLRKSFGEAILPEEEGNVFGYQAIPEGYQLRRIGRYVETEPYPHFDIPSSRNPAKVAASIIQLFFACATLYRSRGQQLEQYGYAAFSLTVIPYAIMSLINLFGSLITPDYTHLYIVESAVLREASAERTRNGIFDGFIDRVEGETQETGNIVRFEREDKEGEKINEGNGTVKWSFTVLGNCVDGEGEALKITVPSGEYPSRQPTKMERFWNVMFYVLWVLVIVAPYVIIAGLTKFNPGKSTASQRGWMMSWLVVGQFAGGLRAAFLSTDSFESKRWETSFVRVFRRGSTGKKVRRIGMIFLFVLFAPPAFGGFVTVGVMLKEFGTCIVA
jgi:hypothetical protein